LAFSLDFRALVWVKLLVTRSLRYRLTEAEKDTLLERQSLLIDGQAAQTVAQAAQIAALLARIEALEAAPAKPRKTSRNSHTPPSQDPRGWSALTAPGLPEGGFFNE